MVMKKYTNANISSLKPTSNSVAVQPKLIPEVGKDTDTNPDSSS